MPGRESGRASLILSYTFGDKANCPMTPRFLHFVPITPSPHGNGLAMRTSMFSEALARLGQVDVVVIGAARPSCTDWKPNNITLHHVSSEGRLDTRLSLISRISDPVKRADALRTYGRPPATIALSAPVVADAAKFTSAAPWSAIVLSRAYLLPILGALPPAGQSAPVLVDLDDDDAALCREWASLARNDGEESEIAWLNAEADAFDSLIRDSANSVRAFACASTAVAHSLAMRLSLSAVHTIPNGVDAAHPETKTSLPQSLIFVGNLSYQPNIDGLLWFIAKVLPLIRARDANIRLVVAGSLPTEAVRKACAAPGISFHPNPRELTGLYRDAGVAVIPLRCGSGSRIKILEAAVHGLPVVATEKGAEGLSSDIRKTIFIGGEQPDSFAGACLACLADERTALDRAAQLQLLVKDRHDRTTIISNIATWVSGWLATPGS